MDILKTRATGATEEDAFEHYLKKLRRKYECEVHAKFLWVFFPNKLRVFALGVKQKKTSYVCFTTRDMTDSWHSDLFEYGTMGVNLSIGITFENDVSVSANHDTLITFSNGDLVHISLHQEKRMLDPGSITRQMELMLRREHKREHSWIASADPNQLKLVGVTCPPKHKGFKELAHFRSASMLEEASMADDLDDIAALFPQKGSASLLPYDETRAPCPLQEQSWVIIQYYARTGEMLSMTKLEFPDGHNTIQIQDTSPHTHIMMRCIVLKDSKVYRSRFVKVYKAREFKKMFSLTTTPRVSWVSGISSDQLCAMAEQE